MLATFWQLFCLAISAPVIAVLGYYYIGWPAFVYLTFHLMELLAPLVAQSAKRQIRNKLNQLTDIRIAIVHDMLQGIRLLNIFAWEEAWEKKLRRGHEEERRQNQRMALEIVIELSFQMVSQRFGVLFTLICCALNGSIHTTDRLMPFLNLLTGMVALHNLYMETTPALANAAESLPRITKYLAAGEKTSQCLGRGESLQMKAAQFTWKEKGRGNDLEVKDEESALLGTDKPAFILEPLDMELRPGELVAIVGSLGSGKSLFLAGLADQASIAGSVELPADPAYFVQKPWIQSGSIRSNVLFGQPYEKERYKRCITAAQLKRDLHELPSGDETIVGELGINLSGGQKARVQMARVLYLRRAFMRVESATGVKDVDAPIDNETDTQTNGKTEITLFGDTDPSPITNAPFIKEERAVRSIPVAVYKLFSPWWW